MRKVLIVILLSIIFLSCCGIPEQTKTIEVEDEVTEEAKVEIMIEVLDEPEFIDLLTDETIGTLEGRSGVVPDEYLENPEEQYVEPTVYESVYTEPIYTTYASYTPYDLMYMGVIYWGGWRFTWYSERVLPGPGLKIPGRWSDGDFVRDENGYICVASSDLAWGTYVDTPWGAGRVYDCGCASGTLDVYVSW